MIEYKIEKKALFESLANFEKRLNNLSMEGWRAKSMTRESASLYILLERDRQKHL